VVTEQRKIQHLYWRAGFGPSYSIFEKGNKLSVKAEVEKLFKDSKETIPLNADLAHLPGKAEVRQMKTMEERKEVKRMNNRLIIDLNNSLLKRFAGDKQILREKMTFFWSGHFACRVNNIRYADSLSNTIREHALGNFGQLLAAVSKEPAMLQFLNNRENRKQHPNENFAREVMELFTLGRGHYTEKDVKEGARAFTGWSFGGAGVFAFYERLHDADSKTFLGETGNFDGDDALKIILKQKQCARFIAAKVYKFFVNDEPDEKIISTLADSFYDSGYDIEKLMHQIFTSGWFYDEKNIGVKIKSPVELLAGMMKSFDLKFADDRALLFYQRVLGQVMFEPPNVSGWPGGKNWIDNSTLMVRLFLAKRLLTGALVDMQPKEEYDMQVINMEKMDLHAYRQNVKMLPLADWSGLLDTLAGIPADKLNDTLVSLFIQTDPKKIDTSLLDKYNDSADETERIKNKAVQVLGLPEYQLC
jgi:uncharacterized protein (DUF1800 family)